MLKKQENDKITPPKSSQVNAMVSWRHYPQERPTREDRYLIYYRLNGTKRTFIADYLPQENRWRNTLNAEILMWADYNKPK